MNTSYQNIANFCCNYPQNITTIAIIPKLLVAIIPRNVATVAIIPVMLILWQLIAIVATLWGAYYRASLRGAYPKLLVAHIPQNVATMTIATKR